MKAVTFLNREGLRLFGILHEPKAAGNMGVLILNPGVKSRVGPHRLYVKMAKVFCHLGFPVLRFDPHGIGDSEGEVEESLAADFYGTVQVGRFVEDTLAAMDWMHKECGTPQFVLAGLCGGAITALLTGARDSRVHQILALGIPVNRVGSHVDPYRYMSQGQLREIQKAYQGKLLSLMSWIRFLSLRSDYRMIFKSFSSAFKHAVRNNSTGSRAAPLTPRSADTDLNPLFPDALHIFAANRRILFIFSGGDRLHWEFDEKYLRHYKATFDTIARNVEIHVIPNANHILSFSDWQEEMIAKVSATLQTHISSDLKTTRQHAPG